MDTLLFPGSARPGHTVLKTHVKIAGISTEIQMNSKQGQAFPLQSRGQCPSMPHQDTMWWNIYRSNSGQRQKGLEFMASLANKTKAQQRGCPLSFAEKNGNWSQVQTPVLLPAGASLVVALRLGFWLALLVTC